MGKMTKWSLLGVKVVVLSMLRSIEPILFNYSQRAVGEKNKHIWYFHDYKQSQNFDSWMAEHEILSS